MNGTLRRVILTLLLASVVGIGVSGCFIPFPVGDGHGHHHHRR